MAQKLPNPPPTWKRPSPPPQPPAKGLTFRQGKREANVHDVKDGIVFYGVYLDGDDWPAGLYQVTLDEWNRLAMQAVENGAEVFVMARSNGEVRGASVTAQPACEASSAEGATSTVVLERKEAQ